MARWQDFADDAPEFAARVRASLDAHVHKTIATLRRDGSPRISGTEARIDDGDLWWGSMWGAVKALDLRRDGRFALHSGSEDPPAPLNDAKVAGRAVEAGPERAAELMAAFLADRGPDDPDPGRAHVFVADIGEVVLTTLGGDPPDHLVIESWRPGEGYVRRERR